MESKEQMLLEEKWLSDVKVGGELPNVLFSFHVRTCLHKMVKEKVEQGYSTQSVIKIACIAVMCRKVESIGSSC